MNTTNDLLNTTNDLLNTTNDLLNTTNDLLSDLQCDNRRLGLLRKCKSRRKKV